MISPSAQRMLSSAGDAPAQIASSAIPSARTVSLTKPWWMARNATHGGPLQSAHLHAVGADESGPPPIPAVTWTTCACGLRPLVVVAVRRQVEDVFAEAFPETVEDRAELPLAVVFARAVRGPVARRHDEAQRGVGLGGGEQRLGAARPVGPRLLRIRLRVDDEADSALIEPVPVLAAASRRRRARRRRGVGQPEASLVVAQVVLLAPPFVVAPYRHVGRAPRPGHDVVEVAIDVGLRSLVAVGQITEPENQRRIRPRDHPVHDRRQRASWSTRRCRPPRRR